MGKVKAMVQDEAIEEPIGPDDVVRLSASPVASGVLKDGMFHIAGALFGYDRAPLPPGELVDFAVGTTLVALTRDGTLRAWSFQKKRWDAISSAFPVPKVRP